VGTVIHYQQRGNPKRTQPGIVSKALPSLCGMVYVKQVGGDP